MKTALDFLYVPIAHAREPSPTAMWRPLLRTVLLLLFVPVAAGLEPPTCDDIQRAAAVLRNMSDARVVAALVTRELQDPAAIAHLSEHFAASSQAALLEWWQVPDTFQNFHMCM